MVEMGRMKVRFSLFLLISILLSSVIFVPTAQAYSVFSLPSRINDMAFYNDVLWVATDGGVFSLDQDGVVKDVLGIWNGLGMNDVRKIGFGDDVIYAMSRDRFVMYFPDKGTSKVFDPSDGFPGAEFVSFGNASQYVAIGTNAGLWVFSLNDNKLWVPQELIGKYVTSLAFIPDGVVVGTYDGLWVADLVSRKVFPVKEGVVVSDMARVGDMVYVASDSGAYVLKLPGFTVRKLDRLSSNKGFSRVVCLSTDVVSFISGRTIYTLSGDKVWKVSLGSEQSYISAAVYSHSGVLYVGVNSPESTVWRGVYKLNSVYASPMWELPGDVRTDVVSFVTEDKTGLLWFKLGDKIYWAQSPGRWFKFSFLSEGGHEVDSSIVSAVAPWITSDKLMLGTILGVYLADKVSRVMSDMDITPYVREAVMDIVLEDGYYYIISRKYVYIYRPQFSYFKPVQLPTGHYSYCGSGYRGYLFLGTSKGVVRIDSSGKITIMPVNTGVSYIFAGLGGVWFVTGGILNFAPTSLSWRKAVFPDIQVMAVGEWNDNLVVASNVGLLIYRFGRVRRFYPSFVWLPSTDVKLVYGWRRHIVIGSSEGLFILTPESDIGVVDLGSVSDAKIVGRLMAMGIIKGDGSGRIMPNRLMRLEEFVIVLHRIIIGDYPRRYSCRSLSADSWAEPYICSYFSGLPPDVDWRQPVTSQALKDVFGRDFGISDGRRIAVMKYFYSLLYSFRRW